MNFLLTIVIFIILVIHIEISETLKPKSENEDEDPYLAPDDIYINRIKDSQVTSSSTPTTKKRKFSLKRNKSRNSKRRHSLGNIYENEHEGNSNSLSRPKPNTSKKSKNGEELPAKVSDGKNHSSRKSLIQRARSRFSRKQSSKNSIYENTSSHGGRKSFLQRLSLRRPGKKKDDNVYETPYNSIHSSSSNSSRRHSNVNDPYLVDHTKDDLIHRRNTNGKPLLHRPGKRGSSIYGKIGEGKQMFYEKYSGFNIEPFLSKHKFSRHIYDKVWSNCDYKCFYEKGYQRFKIRAYLQVNLFRKYHYAQPLTQNSILNKLAQDHADKMARRRSIIKFYSILYGATIGVTYYPAASTIVTRWYDEYKNYSFVLNYAKPGSQQLTQMIWKDSKEIGVGAARGGDFLYLVCIYYPKGNINGLYRKNVLSRKKNWQE